MIGAGLAKSMIVIIIITDLLFYFYFLKFLLLPLRIQSMQINNNIQVTEDTRQLYSYKTISLSGLRLHSQCSFVIGQ